MRTEEVALQCLEGGEEGGEEGGKRRQAAQAKGCALGAVQISLLVSHGKPNSQVRGNSQWLDFLLLLQKQTREHRPHLGCGYPKTVQAVWSRREAQ